MRNILVISLTLISFSNANSQNTISLESGQSSPKATIDQVEWITGHWRGEGMGGIMEEIWAPPVGNAMAASFRLVKFNKASFYELETITEENETLILRLKHFHGNLKGWEEKD